jgi:hypothetical protein
MRTSETGSKGAQGALFVLAGLCFLLPFVSLSCASEEAAEGMELEEVDQELTGVELVIGGVEREGFDSGSPMTPPDPEIQIPPEPSAAIALGAALVGLGFVLVRVTRTRLLGASIAGAVGAVSLVLLAMSPTLRALGLSAVTLLFGFWIALGLFVLAGAAHALQLRSTPSLDSRPPGDPDLQGAAK